MIFTYSEVSYLFSQIGKTTSSNSETSCQLATVIPSFMWKVAEMSEQHSSASYNVKFSVQVYILIPDVENINSEQYLDSTVTSQVFNTKIKQIIMRLINTSTHKILRTKSQILRLRYTTYSYPIIFVY